LKNSPLGRDCLTVAESYLIRQGLADVKAIKEWHKDALHSVEEAVATVQHEAAPDPYKEDWSALSTNHLREGSENR